MIFVGIPAYDGRICAETTRSLLNEQAAAALVGVEIQVAFLPGCSLITHARNQIVQDFLETDCTRLVFVDSDVAWEPGALLRLAGHTVDVVGGAYRLKSDEEAYPVVWLDKPELWAENGLLEVRSLPGGFLAISREALLKLKAEHPDRGYSHYGRDYHGWFHAPIRDGGMYGEDAAFCADWINMGERLWLDPELTLTHVGGSRGFVGNIGNWLRSR